MCVAFIPVCSVRSSEIRGLLARAAFGPAGRPSRARRPELELFGAGAALRDADVDVVVDQRELAVAARRGARDRARGAAGGVAAARPRPWPGGAPSRAWSAPPPARRGRRRARTAAGSAPIPTTSARADTAARRARSARFRACSRARAAGRDHHRAIAEQPEPEEHRVVPHRGDERLTALEEVLADHVQPLRGAERAEAERGAASPARVASLTRAQLAAADTPRPAIWSRCRRSYTPPRASSSACRPDSTSRPRCST